MLPFQVYVITFSIQLSSLVLLASSSEPVTSSSIYEALLLHGLPMGLLPKGVNNFTLDNSGKFQVHLDQACNAKFENEIHYDTDVSGTLSYGQIDELSGISAQDLFLWFPVKEIRVDIPSSGLIYFDVGVVSKQFSLSLFETPRDCVAVQLADGELQDGEHVLETLSKNCVAVHLADFGFQDGEHILEALSKVTLFDFDDRYNLPVKEGGLDVNL